MIVCMVLYCDQVRLVLKILLLGEFFGRQQPRLRASRVSGNWGGGSEKAEAIYV